MVSIAGCTCCVTKCVVCLNPVCHYLSPSLLLCLSFFFLLPLITYVCMSHVGFRKIQCFLTVMFCIILVTFKELRLHADFKVRITHQCSVFICEWLGMINWSNPHIQSSSYWFIIIQNHSINIYTICVHWGWKSSLQSDNATWKTIQRISIGSNTV